MICPALPSLLLCWLERGDILLVKGTCSRFICLILKVLTLLWGRGLLSPGFRSDAGPGPCLRAGLVLIVRFVLGGDVIPGLAVANLDAAEEEGPGRSAEGRRELGPGRHAAGHGQSFILAIIVAMVRVASRHRIVVATHGQSSPYVSVARFVATAVAFYRRSDPDISW